MKPYKVSRRKDGFHIEFRQAPKYIVVTQSDRVVAITQANLAGARLASRAYRILKTPNRFFKDRTHKARESVRMIGKHALAFGNEQAFYCVFLETGTKKMRARRPMMRSLIRSGKRGG